MNPITEKPSLEQTLQALYDSEINVTITMLWDGGVDQPFKSVVGNREIFEPLTPTCQRTAVGVVVVAMSVIPPW